MSSPDDEAVDMVGGNNNNNNDNDNNNVNSKYNSDEMSMYTNISDFTAEKNKRR